MFPLLLILSATVVWSFLAHAGVRLGLQRKVVVFRSWSDFAMTAVTVSFALIGWISFMDSSDESQLVRALTLIAVLLWLWRTRRTNRRARDLWVVVPAKLSIVVFAVFCAALSLGCSKTALSRKTENRERLINGAIAFCAAKAAWSFFRVIHRLVTGASAASFACRAHRRAYHVGCGW